MASIFRRGLAHSEDNGRGLEHQRLEFFHEASYHTLAQFWNPSDLAQSLTEFFSLLPGLEGFQFAV